MVLDVDKVHIEPGVQPDIEVNISKEDSDKKIDTILERAIVELSK
jgi:hypothetical protein